MRWYLKQVYYVISFKHTHTPLHTPHITPHNNNTHPHHAHIPPTHTPTLVNTPKRGRTSATWENTSNWGHTHLIFSYPNGDSLSNAYPTGDSPYTYQPGSMVYMLLYAFWVNWGPSGNRGRTRLLSVCSWMMFCQVCVPVLGGDYKRTHGLTTFH